MKNCNNCANQIEPFDTCEWLKQQDKIIIPPCPNWISKELVQDLSDFIDENYSDI